MAFWLVKTEPDAYSFATLCQVGHTRWDGVRNYTARNNLRLMKPGERVLVYHSNIGLEVVGVAEVAGNPYVDPGHANFTACDMKPVGWLGQPVPLSLLKSDASLQGLALIRQSRLSVMPVSQAEFDRIVELGGGIQPLLPAKAPRKPRSAKK